MSSQIRLRVSVVGLFIDNNEVLLLHQTTPPEPNCWDLPGGGLEPGETLMNGLQREIQEETGLTQFQVEGLLTVIESFFPEPEQRMMHTLNLVYKCKITPKPLTFTTSDPEVGSQGIQWLAIATLNREICSTRTWKALIAAGLVDDCL